MSETTTSLGATDYFSASVPLAQGIFGMFAAAGQARALKADARTREMEGAAEANRRSAEGRAAVAAGVVYAASSGFTTEGSATDVLARMAAEAETNAANARWEASRDADQLRYEAKLRKRQALFGLIGGVVSAGAQLVTGGG